MSYERPIELMVRSGDPTSARYSPGKGESSKTIAAAFIILFSRTHCTRTRSRSVASADLRRLRATSPIVERALEVGYAVRATFRRLRGCRLELQSHRLHHAQNAARHSRPRGGVLRHVHPGFRYVRIEVDTQLPRIRWWRSSDTSCSTHSRSRSCAADCQTMRPLGISTAQSVQTDPGRAGPSATTPPRAVSAGWRVEGAGVREPNVVRHALEAYGRSCLGSTC